MQDCKDCPQLKALESKLATLCQDIRDGKEEMKTHEKRISDLEGAQKVSEERFNRIFEMVEKIERKIDRIAEALESFKMKGPNTFDNLKYKALEYIIITAILGTFVKFIANAQ